MTLIRLRAAGWLLAATFLTGCATAPQLPVPLGPTALGSQGVRVGVAMAPLPKVDTEFPGAGCLLCYAAASVTNSGLTSHARTLPYEDLPKLAERVAELVRGKGGSAQVIPDELKVNDLPDFAASGANIARKDFTALRNRYGVDKLVVVSLTTLGFERTYASYVPTADPKAVLRGTAFMVDLKSNAYEWYQPLSVLRSADGAWDEPAKYPGLTNAYYQAIELGKDEVLKPFKP